jgi:hypothetical protein
LKTEIRKITIPCHSGQKKKKKKFTRPPWEKKVDMRACTYNPSYSKKHKIEDRSPGWPREKATSYLK